MIPRPVATLALAIALHLAAAPAPARDGCAPWPGEFDPLPTVGDSDPLRARWAKLRAEQLVARAAPLERSDSIEANRLWQRVLCLDPENAIARAGVERSRPAVVLAAPEPRPPAPAPRVAVTRRSTAPEERAPSLDAPLRRAEQLIRSAHFEDALQEIERLRPRFESAQGDVATPERVRLEVLAATAHIAFGDERAARESFARALEADPGFAPDVAATPPKLLRVFEEARGAQGREPSRP